ncbi:MAG: hypothetical protein EBY39_10560 [Flavobacteriia bacterium]|nr:hypothetical protein [Flavobacteriia bacterium]
MKMMFDNGINNDFEDAHQKGLTRGFDLGWSYKGKFDRVIIEDEIKSLEKQLNKVSDPEVKLRILAQKDILRKVFQQIKYHPNNRENIANHRQR